MSLTGSPDAHRLRAGRPLVLGSLVALGVSVLAAPAAAAPASPAAPERTAVIVQLTPGSDAAAESRRAAADGGTVSHVYGNVFRGFAGEFTDRAIARLRANSNVRLVEPDGVATASAMQTGATWGLDRVDQADGLLDGNYTYPDAAGAGVRAYVIDTGISPHGDFGTRLAPGTSTVKGQRTTADCDGHGTHVAGTIGGSTYGVAKAVTLVPVRVLNCQGSGTWSGIIAGIDWTVGNHTSGPAVANMSLGGPANQSVDDAVKRLIADGVTVAVAAGNSNADAAGYSPARVARALTVGATDSSDVRASFSNYGTGVDLFAPGVGITSTWLSGGTSTISGTSMASPHVAGAAALVLSGAPAATPDDVASTLVARATTGRVADEKTSPDLRLRGQ